MYSEGSEDYCCDYPLAADPTHYQVVIALGALDRLQEALLCSLCQSVHWSDDTTTNSIIDLRPRLCTVDILMFEHGASYTQTVVCTEVQQLNITWVHIRQAIPPNHAFPILTIIVHKRVEIPQEGKDFRKVGYSGLLFVT